MKFSGMQKSSTYLLKNITGKAPKCFGYWNDACWSSKCSQTKLIVFGTKTTFSVFKEHVKIASHATPAYWPVVKQQWVCREVADGWMQTDWGVQRNAEAASLTQ